MAHRRSVDAVRAGQATRRRERHRDPVTGAGAVAAEVDIRQDTREVRCAMIFLLYRFCPINVQAYPLSVKCLSKVCRLR